MNNDWTRDIELKLEELMGTERLLKTLNWTEKDVALTLRQSAYRRGFHKLMKEQPRFSCEELLNLCRITLDTLSPEPEMGWLSYCFMQGKHILYPENFPDLSRPEYEKGYVFLMEFLHGMYQIEELTKGFEPTLYYAFATEEEIGKSASKEEYQVFLRFCRDYYLVEFMRIGSEITPFNTLGHIAGVHHIAMSMARQLCALGAPVDLPLMSGAAIGHDIGKYGCKDKEARRVPYLHYYYTDQCLTRFGMPLISHIAANHSTWDLELENLSVESLLLIYADFRVKSTRNAEGKEEIHFYTLADSFQVILDKLDNVDAAKRERYRRVYEKLSDFEMYMKSLGVYTEEPDAIPVRIPEKDSALLFGEQVVDAYKNNAIQHNIRLMHILNYEKPFGNILEVARSDKEWKNTRSYINILAEYSTYMNQKQKLLTLNFLYELLMHREGDIRQKAAGLLGRMIVDYDTEYRKEIPDGLKAFSQEYTSLELFERYVQKILVPDHKITDKHREWLGYMLEYFLDGVFSRCKPSKRQDYIRVLLQFYQDTDREEFFRFVMLIAILKLPLEELNDDQHEVLLHFIETCAPSESMHLRIAVLRTLHYYVGSYEFKGKILRRCHEIDDMVDNNGPISIRFLKHRLGVHFSGEEDDGRWLEDSMELTRMIAGCFLENLKAGTHWICKQINVFFLDYLIEKGLNNQPVHTTTHLANLLTVSECGDVRRQAGETLVDVADLLTIDQRNEVCVELLKGLELEGNEFAKYIPRYLGLMILKLQPQEVDEFIASLETLFFHANDQTAAVIIDTFGVLIENYPDYCSRSKESSIDLEERLKRIMGFLMRGLANDHEMVSQEAFYIIGEYIFGSSSLTLEQKYHVFRYMGKKVLHILKDQTESPLRFLIYAASLNHIYRFIADYIFEYGSIPLPSDEKIAFFPGTFDPFSLSHLGIVQEIRALGFEVYLAIDEFSWSKKTQPRLIRRKIAAMSVADDSGVFMFPDDIPVNIANRRDLERLSQLFEDKKIYMVVGSDVLEHASAYRKPLAPYSIQQFNHIVFRRNSDAAVNEKESDNLDAKALIHGEVLNLSLSVHLEDISSTLIRENIDLNRDISNLMDPIAQKYIYENNLYLREPQYKPLIDTQYLRFEVVKEIPNFLRQTLRLTLFRDKGICENVLAETEREGRELFLIWGDNPSPTPLACALFRQLPLADLIEEFKDLSVTSMVRERVAGKLLLLEGLYLSPGTEEGDMRQLLLTETLAQALKEEYTYCVYHGKQNMEECRQDTIDLLMRQGFLPIHEEEREVIYGVDMYKPMTLTKNLSLSIKAPFNTNPRVLKVIDASHRRLQTALTHLYPGKLVLSFDSNIMHQRLVDKITEENHVPNRVVQPRKLGEKMCVPYGKMLRGSVVPNTVTKALHTERVFNTDMKGFTIQEFPDYSPLRTQIRTIKSFDRKTILVDDLLHKGYRLDNMYHFFKEEQLEINKIIVGILTGRGRDLIDSLGLKADSVYFLPNLGSWFVESTLYPFIGGDSVEGGTRMPGLITSVNLILPYVAMGFLVNHSSEVAYEISMICLENTRDILQVLEQEYQKEFERNLTLERLSEAIHNPTCPDKGRFMSYDSSLPASVYIENDIQRLIRLKNVM